MSRYLYVFGIIAAMIISIDALLLSNTLNNNMVLQRAPSEAVIWGWEKAGSKVVVTIEESQYYAISDANGKFFVKFKHAEGGPYNIKITSSSGEAQQLTNVLFGDVYICGGQSNMQFSVPGVFNATQEIAKASQYPKIRLFSVGEKTVSDKPLDQLATIDLTWSVASPATVGNNVWSYFSAVCWFFGKDLYDLDPSVPIGLISSNWGGTIIEAWSSLDALAKCPKVAEEERVYPEGEAIINSAEGADPNQPSVLWNAMIVPFLNTSIKGAIWYQGEQNSGAPIPYRCQFPAMISDWRKKFVGGNNFPFLFVQLAPWVSDQQTIPDQRQSQLSALTLPNVGFATAVDLGDISSPQGNIHPRNKQEVSRRLAQSARAVVYGQKSVVWKGPLATKAVIGVPQNSSSIQIIISFDNSTTEGGLKLKPVPNCPQSGVTWCSGLEVTMSDSKKYPAVGSIEGATFKITASVLPSLKVKSVSYAWAPWPLCFLYNGEGLPAIPFQFEF